MVTSSQKTDWRYTHKGIIYMIENRINGKRYIGQTIKSFAQRYPACRWWENSNNPYLRSAVQKHGIEAFSVQMLEHSKTLKQLNELEEHYAKTLNTYAPAGYNLVGCGTNKIQHPTSVAKRSRTIILNDPSGRDVTITNIRRFCREHDLDNRGICRVVSGKHASHKGWSLAGVTAKHPRTKHHYVLYSKDGVRHNITGLSDFCRTRGLKYYQMRDLVQGRVAESQGYARQIEDFAKQRQKHVVTLAKGELQVTLLSIKPACALLGLSSSYVYRLIAGKIPSYKGWVVKELTSQPR